MIFFNTDALRPGYGRRMVSGALAGRGLLSELPIMALLLMALSLAAGPCGASDSSSGTAPTLPGRPLSSRVAEPSSMTQLQARLDALGATEATGCEVAYQANKAQAWLNFEEYAAQNEVPKAVSAAALRNAADIIEALETHAPLSLETPELPKARHVRDDLWRSVAAVKVDGRRCGAPKMTAYCEVQLAWVGYEASDGGWRHVDPYVRIAEDYCTTASAAIAMPVVAPLAVAAPSIDLMPAELRLASIAPVSEDIDLSIFVLFPHDRSAREDIRAPGRAELVALAEHMKTLPASTVITVMGHADITGAEKYNQALSERRAQTVATELSALGVDPSRIQLGAAGAKEPLVNCSNDRAHAQYLACLEPNRRVVVHLVGDTLEAAALVESAASRVPGQMSR
jgi:outer membrane protein OmpA-like peptidoglycan-associated protein